MAIDKVGKANFGVAKEEIVWAIGWLFLHSKWLFVLMFIGFIDEVQKPNLISGLFY